MSRWDKGLHALTQHRPQRHEPPTPPEPAGGYTHMHVCFTQRCHTHTCGLCVTAMGNRNVIGKSGMVAGQASVPVAGTVTCHWCNGTCGITGEGRDEKGEGLYEIKRGDYTR